MKDAIAAFERLKQRVCEIDSQNKKYPSKLYVLRGISYFKLIQTKYYLNTDVRQWRVYISFYMIKKLFDNNTLSKFGTPKIDRDCMLADFKKLKDAKLWSLRQICYGISVASLQATGLFLYCE